MSTIVANLVTLQQQLSDKLSDGDPSAKKAFDAFKTALDAARDALANCGDPELADLLQKYEEFCASSEDEVILNQTAEYTAIKANRIAINAAFRTLQNSMKGNNLASVVSAWKHVQQVIANHTPTLEKSAVGQKVLSQAQSRLSQLEPSYKKMERFTQLKDITSNVYGVKTFLESHLSRRDPAHATKSLEEFIAKLKAIEPLLNGSDAGKEYLAEANEYIAQCRAQIDKFNIYASVEKALKSVTSEIYFTRVHLTGSSIGRDTRVKAAWDRVVAAAAPLAAENFQTLPEVWNMWNEYDAVEAEVRKLLGDAAVAGGSGKPVKKPRKKVAGMLKNLYTTVNDVVSHTLIAANVPLPEAPRRASQPTLRSSPSARVVAPAPVPAPTSAVPVNNTYVAAPPQREPSPKPALPASEPEKPAVTAVALVEYQGDKSKLTLRADSIDGLVADIQTKLNITQQQPIVEVEDADFPGHYINITKMDLPLPPKLILRVKAALPTPPAATQSASLLPTAAAPQAAPHASSSSSSSSIGIGQLNFRIPLSELEFGAKIGSGSFGQVWSAYWRGQPVAVKESIVEKPEARQEFLAEAGLMINLRPHRHVVQVLGLAEGNENQFYLVMDLMKTSLEKIAADPHKREEILNNPKVMREYALGIAAGMSHLEAEGIVHRDLACRNILVNEAGVVKISDFGMSRRIDGPEAAGKTNSNIGPIRWMAPENFNRVYSSKSDVWSYACTIVEFMTGKAPHADMDLLECALKIRDEGLSPEVPSSADPVLADVLRHCWQRDPADRPTFAQIAAVLRQAQ